MTDEKSSLEQIESIIEVLHGQLETALAPLDDETRGDIRLHVDSLWQAYRKLGILQGEQRMADKMAHWLKETR